MSITIKQRAVQFAALVNADETAKKVIHEGVETKEKAKRTTQLVYIQLFRVFGPERLNTMPKPGVEGGNNPDKYEDVDMNGSKVTGSFSGDLADALEEGQEITTALRNFAQDTTMGDPEKEAAVSMWTGRRNSLRRIVRDCLLVWHQWQAIKLLFPTVKLSLKTVIKNGVSGYDNTTTKPVCVTDGKPKAEGDESPQAYRYLSIGEFLALKLERAQVNAASMGEWKALLKSSKKGGKKRGKDGTVAGARVARITTVDTAMEYMSELSAWFGDVDGAKGGKESGYGKIMSRLANLPKGDDRKHFVLTLGRCIYGLDGVGAEIDAEYQTYVAEQNRIQAAEATAKAGIAA